MSMQSVGEKGVRTPFGAFPLKKSTGIIVIHDI